MAAINIQFTRIEIKIAKYIFKHYKNRHNARQLAKILNINHAHANKLCHLLTNKNLLIDEDIGNATYFSYNYRDALAIKFIEYILSMEEKEVPKWLTVLLHSLQKFNPRIKMGLIFGSSIKNREYNDIDILLMYDASETKEIRKIKDEIRQSELIEKPIRYVEITEKDIKLNKENNIFYNILSENIIFHNPEKYVEMVKKNGAIANRQASKMVLK